MSFDNNDWTVLFIGGASGTGKSSIAYELAEYYNVNVMEADDVCEAVKAMTTIKSHPAIHYWSTGVNWLDIGVTENVEWLIRVSKEITPALKAIAERHIVDNLPVIIEGDFIHPELVKDFNTPEVKGVFLKEQDKNQIMQNYLAREGGELQHYRAEISIAYDKWLSCFCEKSEVKVVESRPWDTVVKRIVECL